MIKLLNGLFIATFCVFLIACGGNSENKNEQDSTANNATNDTTTNTKVTPPPRPKTSRDFLCQKWGYDTKSFVDALEANMPANSQGSKMPPEQRKVFVTMAEKAFYHFNTDGTYTGVVPAGTAVKGTWSLSSDQKILTIRAAEGGNADIRVIESITADKLVWKISRDEQSMSFAMVPFTDKTTTEKPEDTAKK